MSLSKLHKTGFKRITGTHITFVLVVLLFMALIAVNFLFKQVKSGTEEKIPWIYETQYVSLGTLERMANRKLVPWAKNPIVVEAVKKANKEKPKTLRELIQLDNKWKFSNVEDKWLSQFLKNPCAGYLKKQQKLLNRLMNICPEIFVTDKYGCIVASTDKTSDYWQGDEDKFIESFAEGKGEIYIRKAEYDDSTQLPLSQISVPVYDPNSQKAIGVMTVGLNIHALLKCKYN